MESDSPDQPSDADARACSGAVLGDQAQHVCDQRRVGRVFAQAFRAAVAH